MVLAIDIGNTNIVIGGYSDDKMIFVERMSTFKSGTAWEYAISFKNVLELYKSTIDETEGGIIASVVPSVTPNVKTALEKVTGKSFMVVGPETKTGLNVVIDNPSELGADLVVGAVAAINQYKAPLIVFDLGTATTVSVIDSSKSFIGGIIMPGVNTSLEALTGKASLLQKVALEVPESIIGRNTDDCMKSGVVFGTAASLDGIIDRIESEMSCEMTSIATGGIAKCIVPYCRHKIITDNELLLKGLMIIYKKNKQ